MPTTKRTIYLSSTFEDLKEHRKAVFRALRKGGYDVKAMEEYVATDERPVDECLADVEQADIYVGVFSFRYGYVPPKEHRNPEQLFITELEYQQAKASQKPRLVFVAKEDAGFLPKHMDAYTGEGDQGKSIQRLRQSLLTGRMAGQFSTPEDLAKEVLAAVVKHESKDQTPSINAGASRSEVVKPQSRITWDIRTQGAPYPGLLHFTRKYTSVFFGREVEVQEILERFQTLSPPFMIISGDSGIGKSSLVDAGLLPVLEAASVTDAQPTESLRLVPSQRQQPMDALLSVLTPLITKAGRHPDALAKELANAPETLGAHLTAILKEGGSAQRLLLFIDQMEELFTAQDLAQTNQLLSVLYQATQERALEVIGTIRSDHLHFCHRHPEMLRVLNSDGHYALGPVQPYMMQDMIIKPAQAAGLTITESFAKRLIHESEADAANLPLLAFVLNKLFEERLGNELSETAYDTFGGVTGVIAAHVKVVEQNIQDSVKVNPHTVLPDIFQTLVKLH